MEKVSFVMQVSSNTPHRTVTICKDGKKITAHCTCESGWADALCKHRLSILVGQFKWVISGNIASVKHVRAWAMATDVGPAIVQLFRAQKSLQEAKLKLQKIVQSHGVAEKAVNVIEEEVNAAREMLIQAMGS